MIMRFLPIFLCCWAEIGTVVVISFIIAGALVVRLFAYFTLPGLGEKNKKKPSVTDLQCECRWEAIEC